MESSSTVQILETPITSSQRDEGETVTADSSSDEPLGHAANQKQFSQVVRAVQFVKTWSKNAAERPRPRPRSSRNDLITEFTARYNQEEWIPVTKKKRWNVTFTASSRYLYWWMFIVTIFVLYNSFVMIARQTFDQLQDEPWLVAIWLTLDFIADGIYIMDIFVQFRTGQCIHYSLCTRNSRIA